MKRIAIFGSPGSGKSTLARKLSTRTGTPAIHLDQHYFYPGWVIKSDMEFRAALTEVVAADCWITDGNYLTESVMVQRIERADTLILLECPRLLCLWRVVRRSVLGYGRVRPDQAAGCPERIDRDFLKFVWNFPPKTERIRKLLTGLTDRKTVYFLNNRDEVEAFLATVEQAQRTRSTT